MWMGFRMDDGIVKTLWAAGVGLVPTTGPVFPWGSEDTGMECGDS